MLDSCLPLATISHRRLLHLKKILILASRRFLLSNVLEIMQTAFFKTCLIYSLYLPKKLYQKLETWQLSPAAVSRPWPEIFVRPFKHPLEFWDKSGILRIFVFSPFSQFELYPLFKQLFLDWVHLQPERRRKEKTHHWVFFVGRKKGAINWRIMESTFFSEKITLKTNCNFGAPLFWCIHSL